MATATLTATNETVEELRRELDEAMDAQVEELRPIHEAEREALRKIEHDYHTAYDLAVAYYRTLAQPIEARHRPGLNEIRQRLQEATTLAVLTANGCGGDYAAHEPALDGKGQDDGWHSYTVRAAGDAFGL